MAIYGKIFFISLHILLNILVRLTNYRISCISFSEAVCNNRHFERPARSDFQAHMREALRTAKERLRHKMYRTRTQTANSRIRQRQDFWCDERPEETVQQTDIKYVLQFRFLPYLCNSFRYMRNTHVLSDLYGISALHIIL